jgi:hypothetical protein
MILIIIMGLIAFLCFQNQSQTQNLTYPPQTTTTFLMQYPQEFSTSPPLKEVNVSTNIGAIDQNYRQIGIITPLNGSSKDNILPLMGRQLFTNRGKWQYYTISNQHNNVKLPISFKGRSALNEYGVDEIYNGDTIYVEGYNDAFRVNVYETNTIKYLPML